MINKDSQLKMIHTSVFTSWVMYVEEFPVNYYSTVVIIAIYISNTYPTIQV